MRLGHISRFFIGAKLRSFSIDSCILKRGRVNVTSLKIAVDFIFYLLLKKNIHVIGVGETSLLPTVASTFVDIATQDV